MKRLTPEKVREIIKRGGYTSRSVNPVAHLEAFASELQDEIEKINQAEIKRLRSELKKAHDQARRFDFDWDFLSGRNTDLEGLLLWTLYHKQGAGSNIGLPIRAALGIGRLELLESENIDKAKNTAEKYMAAIEIETYCLGYTHEKCDTCQNVANWEFLCDFPDQVRIPIQKRAFRINDEKCRLTSMGEYVQCKEGG